MTSRRERTSGLRQAARERALDADERLREAIRSLDGAGHAVTVSAVAREAGVARQTVYARKDLIGEIEQLRRPRPRSSKPSTASLRASEASLLARNSLLLDENQALRAELHRARERISVLMAQVRLGEEGTPTKLSRVV